MGGLACVTCCVSSASVCPGLLLLGLRGRGARARMDAFLRLTSGTKLFDLLWPLLRWSVGRSVCSSAAAAGLVYFRVRFFFLVDLRPGKSWLFVFFCVLSRR